MKLFTNTKERLSALALRLVRRFRRQPHAWKETRRETLGHFTHFGSCPQEMTTMYRVGVFETCLLTGESRIRQIHSLHPQDSSPNIPVSQPVATQARKESQ